MGIQLPDLTGRIRIDDSALEKVGQSTRSLGDKLSSTGKALTLGLTTPIIAAGAAGVKMAMDVDRGLREVNTLFGQTGTAAEKTFQELQSGVAGLSNEIGVAQDVLVSGLYSAISAGVPKENAFQFMEIAAKAAIAGVTDTETAVDGLTTTLNAFGLDATRAQDVADSMFTAVKGGKTTFEELSASLFQVAPAAAAAGVEFTDVNAALAALTASGTPTSVATTQMRAAIVELTKGGTEASKAFEKVSGKTFPDFIAEGGNLQDALNLMKQEADSSGKSMLDMFGSVEAGQAALTLTGTAAEKFASEMDNQANSAGAAQTAFEEMEKSGARKLEATMVRLKNGLIQVGNVLLPIVASIVEWVGKLAEKFGTLSPAVQKGIVIFGGLVAAIGPVMWIIGSLMTNFGMLIGVVKNVGIAFKAMSLIFMANPFVLVIAAVVALAYIIYKNWDTIKEAIGNAWEWVKEKTSGWGEAMKTILATIGRVLLAVLTGGLSEIVMAVVRNWDDIKAKTSEIWEGIKSFFSDSWNTIKQTFSTAVENVKQTLSNAWNNIKATAANIWDGFKAYLSTTWENIKSTISTAVENARQRAVDGFNRLKDGVIEKINNLLSEVRAIPGKVLSALGDLGSTLWNAGKSLMDGLLGGIKRAWENVKSYLSGLATKIKNLKGPIDKDKKLLIPAGNVIMEGLEKGLRAKEGMLRSRLSHITDMFRSLELPNPENLGDRLSQTAMGRTNPGMPQVAAVGNSYTFNVSGTWDLSNPKQAFEFGEKVVAIVERVERSKE